MSMMNARARAAYPENETRTRARAKETINHASLQVVVVVRLYLKCSLAVNQKGLFRCGCCRGLVHKTHTDTIVGLCVCVLQGVTLTHMLKDDGGGASCLNECARTREVDQLRAILARHDVCNIITDHPFICNVEDLVCLLTHFARVR